MHNTHILLVDRDDDFLADTSRVLEYFTYKVTTSKTGWKAISLLMDETEKFDLLLVEVQLPNTNNFILLHEAICKGIPTILMSNIHDFEVVKVTLQYDVCFYLDKPIAIEALKNIWQHAIKNERNKAKNISLEAKNNVVEVILENKILIKEELLGKRASNGGRKGKPHIRWTEKLHGKFMEAIHQLGDKNCYPKDILELMNEPDLNRMQVASHLQKCRLGLWHGPKRNRVINPSRPYEKEGKGKYGAMPIFENSSNALQSYQTSSESYELTPTGNYFGVDHHFTISYKTLNYGYQLPKMDDNMSFSQVLGVPSLNSKFLDQTQGGGRA